MAKVEIRAHELARSIVNSVIKVYSVPGKITDDSVKIDEYGVVSDWMNQKDERGEEHLILRFRFVTDGDCFITAKVNAKRYVMKPHQSVFELHNEIRLAINEQMDKRQPLTVMSKAPLVNEKGEVLH